MTVFQYITLKKKTPPRPPKVPQKPPQPRKKHQKKKNAVENITAGCNGASISKILFARAAFHARPCMAGCWKREDALSDRMTPLYKLANLGWVARKKQDSLQYLEIEDTPKHFRRTLKGRFLELSDTFPVGGQPENMPHRWDQRKGKMKGMVEQTPSGPRTWVKWGQPHGLEMWRLHSISSDGQTLTVHTSAISRDGLEDITVKTVYSRIVA